MAIIIQNGTIVSMDADGTTYSPGYIKIEGHRIVDIGAGSLSSADIGPTDEIIDATGHVVYPGFVNVHSHVYLTSLRGRSEDAPSIESVYGMQLPMRYTVTPEESYALARLGMLEILRFGSTTLVDSSANMDAVAAAARDMGIRTHLVAGLIHDANLGPVVDGEYTYDPAIGQRTLQEAVDFIDRWHGEEDGRLQVMLGPHASDTCSEQLWRDIVQVAAAKKVGITSHMLQNRQEVHLIESRYGRAPFRWLADIGVLEHDFLAAHCVHVDDEEIAVMAEYDVALAHCPAILAKRGATAPAGAMSAAGVKIGFGTDNMSGDIVEAMRYALTSWRIRTNTPDEPKPEQIMRMATIGGAEAVRAADQVGSLETGKLADITIVDYRKPHLTPHFEDNTMSNFVHCGLGNDVATVIVDGRVLVRDGKFLLADENDIMREAQEAAAQAWDRLRSGESR